MNQRFVQPVFQKGSMQGLVRQGIVGIFSLVVLAGCVGTSYPQRHSIWASFRKFSIALLLLSTILAMGGCVDDGGSGGGDSGELKSITLTPDSPASIEAGQYQQFVATGTFADSTTEDITAAVSWASSDSDVALLSDTVGEEGLAFGQLGGTADITATVSGITSNTALMTVHEKVLSNPGPPPVDPCPTPSVVNPTLTGRDVALRYPFRISATENGWFLVSDFMNKLVVSVDPATGQPSRSMHIDGNPTGVVMHGKEIFVANITQRSIEIYCYNGKFLGHLAESGTIAEPIDMVVDNISGHLYVLDMAAPNIVIYDIATRTRLVSTLADGQLTAPIGIAVDPVSQKLYVTDRGIRYGGGMTPDAGSIPASIRIFSYAFSNFDLLLGEISGGFCGSFSCSTTGFSNPRGLTVHNGFIYMTDALRGQVMVFNQDTLAYTTALGQTGDTDRELRMPSDVVIDAGGDVFVANTLRKSIYSFPGGAQ